MMTGILKFQDGLSNLMKPGKKMGNEPVSTLWEMSLNINRVSHFTTEGDIILTLGYLRGRLNDLIVATYCFIIANC